MIVPSRQTALAYLVLGLVAVLGYALLASGATLLFNGLVGPDNPWLLGLAAFLMAIVFQPALRAVHSGLSRLGPTSSAIGGSTSAPAQSVAEGSTLIEEQGVAEAFSRALAHMTVPGEIARELRVTLETILGATNVHVFIPDANARQLIAAPDGTNRPTSELRFELRGPLT